MHAFRALLHRIHGYRHYARVDQAGICTALRHCSQRPMGEDWIEVTTPHVGWLNRPLPDRARIMRRDRSLAMRLAFMT